jgi:hypothetical protein
LFFVMCLFNSSKIFYLRLLTILFLCIFHFSPKLNFHLYAYYRFSRASHFFFRNFPFSCTCQYLVTCLVLLPFPTSCVIFSFVLDALWFGFWKVEKLWSSTNSGLQSN